MPVDTIQSPGSKPNTIKIKHEPEPAGGMTLKGAFDRFVDPEKIHAFQEARKAPGAGRRAVFRGSPEAEAKRHAEFAERVVIHDLRNRFERGDLVAWGSEGKPTAVRTRVHDRAWPYLVPYVQSDTIAGPNKLKIYGVRVYTRNEVERWEDRQPPANHSAFDEESSENASIATTANAPNKKEPVYTQVAKLWDELDRKEKKLIDERGRKAKLARDFHEQMPGIPLETVQREFRRMLKDERDGKAGKNTGK